MSLIKIAITAKDVANRRDKRLAAFQGEANWRTKFRNSYSKDFLDREKIRPESSSLEMTFEGGKKERSAYTNPHKVAERYEKYKKYLKNKKIKRIASGIMIGSTIAGTGIYLHNKKKK